MGSVEEFERLAGVEIERIEGEALPLVTGVKRPKTINGVEIVWIPSRDSETEPE